eukprot:CAMPEP_0175978804 /NCGR_PEP_ID=MMETSP0108-20121206/45864_1 /TAXON_ID=195067 ORGANISM="Goniomonas pacifica, Strain CCMP1869" /NCGR_SAMPLE_ID=MMETSP0108 /ASSEMBLY_ACC=CAM_ASM_000204 /LENGTH=81 /DNA_ID=CAMNT_0017309025 /DNA_START=38 /DNA_END=280 /DNA_ORIENTATION=-
MQTDLSDDPAYAAEYNELLSQLECWVDDTMRNTSCELSLFHPGCLYVARMGETPASCSGDYQLITDTNVLCEGPTTTAATT